LLQLSGLPSPFVTPGGNALFLVADDSMITLRIAHNVADGFGPYFNPGEHLAANTSLSMPFLLSPVFHFAYLAEAVRLLSMVSMALSMAILMMVSLFAENISAAVLTVATLALLPTMRLYAPTIWEHIPQCLFVTTGLCVVLGRWPQLARWRYEAGLLFLTAAFWLRPDCLPLMLPIMCVIAWRIKKGLNVSSAAALLISIAAIAGYFALHFHFYGAFLPNTYYLKVSFGPASIAEGLFYVARTVLDSATPLALLALLLMVLLRHRGMALPEAVVCVGLLLQLFYIVFVGGDVFPCGRFFLLISPMVWMLFWEKTLDVMKDTPVRRQAAGVWAIRITLFCFLLAQIKFLADQEQQKDHNIQVYGRSSVSLMPDPPREEAALSEYIQSHFTPADGQVGLFYLGALGYYLPNYHIADFLGKADAVIAHEPVKWGPVGHNKWDIHHTLEARHVAVIPYTLIPVSSAEDALRRKQNFAFIPALELDPYLRAHYTYFSPERLGLGYSGLLVRNDLVNRVTPPPHDPESTEQAGK
jgi:hypothetical protein